MDGFRERVHNLVGQIPSGRVITYGQIAALCGNPRAARIVGGIAHNGSDKLPWHRVVKSGGHLAEGFPGGVEGHKQALAQEGVQFDTDGTIKGFQSLLWAGK